MKKNKRLDDSEDLRKRAEESLKAEPDWLNKTNLEEASSLIYELQVHQIELDIQNEELRRLQNDLEISRSRFSDLYDFAPVGYLTLDKNGLIVDLNLTAARQLGVERGHLLEKPFLYFVFQLDKGEFLSYLKMILDNRERQIVEIRLSPRGGEQFYARLEGIYIEGEDGTGLCRTSMSDVTLHKKAEQKAIQLAAIVESSGDAIIGKTPDGIITSWNRGAEKIYGYTESEVIGKPISILLLPGHEDEMPEILGKIKSGEHIQHYETERRRKDGQVIWMSLMISPVRNAEGKIVAASTIGRDITERKRAGVERKQLLMAIEQAGEAIVMTDTQGIIQFVNPAFEQMTGYTRVEALGQNPRILKSGKHDELFYRNLWDTISGGGTWAGRMVNKRKDGTLYTEEMTIAPVRDASGCILSYVAVKRDITEYLNVTAQFQQAQKMEAVGVLAGGAAHDYNNMLSVILGYTELALKKVDPAHPLYANLEEIQKAAIRSADITRQLLAFARKQTIIPVVLDLNRNVESMLKMLRRLIGEDIELAWVPEMDLWPVKMDPVQVDQILANLCVNAKDAIADIGRVTIETRNVVLDETYCIHHSGFRAGEYVILAVSDDGCGMDREILDRIFEPFFTSKGMGQGTGLGLSTVYGIVEQNNGFMNVYSEPGHGTTFRICLPRYAGQADDIQQGTAAEIPLGRSETVLLVEDQPELLALTKTMLEKLGYRVLCAGTSDEAVELTEKHASKIQLLITDVIMPGMNGRDLAERLKCLHRSMKTLFMSGYTADVIVNRGMLDENVNFIPKPFSMKGLAVKVREALREK
jgi:PAS domain S-box-containing protein